MTMGIGSKAMSALRWSAGAKLVGQLIAWSMTIIVIRLLSPDDYGLMAISMLFVGFLTLFNEMGLRAVIIQMARLDDKIICQINGLVILLNTLLFAFLYTSSEAIAQLFDDNRLILMVQVLSTHFLISSLEIVPTSLLIRNLELKKKEIVHMSGYLLGGLVSLIMAFQGFGVWSIVTGNLLNALFCTIIINIISPKFWVPSFNFSNMRSVMSFGGVVTLERIMTWLYTKADIFIVGKLLGNEILGFYSVAMQLASLIMHKTEEMLYNVISPTFSNVQKNPEKITLYFLKSVRSMSFVVFPVFLCLSVISSDLVRLILDEKWSIVGPVMSMLALSVPFRMLCCILPSALQGMGHPRISTINILFASLVMPVAFLIGINWGIMGVSIAWVITFPFVFLIMLLRSRDVLGITIRSYLEAISLPFISSIIMYILLLSVNTYLLQSTDLIYRLLISIALGGFIFYLLTKTILRKRLDEVLEVIRR